MRYLCENVMHKFMYVIMMFNIHTALDNVVYCDACDNCTVFSPSSHPSRAETATARVEDARVLRK